MTDSTELRISDRTDAILNWTAHILFGAMLLGPSIAHASSASGAYSGITSILSDIANLLIYEWGYYLGIITLAIQGIRWKTGRIDLMTLFGWFAGIGIVFFAPTFVRSIRDSSGGRI